VDFIKVFDGPYADDVRLLVGEFWANSTVVGTLYIGTQLYKWMLLACNQLKNLELAASEPPPNIRQPTWVV
jgi:hypothetical protein